MRFSYKYLVLLSVALVHYAFKGSDGMQDNVENKQNINVIIIGLDGFMPDAFPHASTPYLDEIIQKGSYTLQGRTVRPTSSSPIWASMLMGAGPAEHGITSNDWRRDTFEIKPVITGAEDIFPTIFSLFHWDRRGRTSAAVFHWGGIGRFIEQSVIDIVIDAPDERQTVLETARIIKEGQPELIFVQIDHVDGAGHRHGFMQPGYFEAVELADTLVGMIINATREAGTYDNTVFILASDHGGIGTSHGGDSPEELTIFVGLSGPGVREGIQVTDPVYVVDVAATAAFFLGIETPRAWYGKPIYCAINGYECESKDR